MKDAALAGGAQVGALAAAAELYIDVCQRARSAGNTAAYYPGINGATLSLLAGDEAAAMRLAREVLNQLAAFAPEQKRATTRRQRSSRRSSFLVMLRALAIWRTGCGRGYGAGSASRLPRIIEHRATIAADRGSKRPRRRVGGCTFAAAGDPLPRTHHRSFRSSGPGFRRSKNPGSGMRSIACSMRGMSASATARWRLAPTSSSRKLYSKRGASVHVVLPFDRDEFIEISVRLRRRALGRTVPDLFGAGG